MGNIIPQYLQGTDTSGTVTITKDLGGIAIKEYKGHSPPIPEYPAPSETVGGKYDSGKVRLELLPLDAVLEIGKVLTHGASKYSDNNWVKGMSWRRVLGSTLRHLFAWSLGESMDKESGLSHFARWLQHPVSNYVRTA